MQTNKNSSYNKIFNKPGVNKMRNPYMEGNKHGADHLKLTAKNMAKKYSLSIKCSNKIFSCISVGVSINKLTESIDYMTSLLTKLGKGPFYINDMIYNMLRYEKCMSAAEINEMLSVCTSEGYDLEDILENTSLLPNACKSELLYGSIKVMGDDALQDARLLELCYNEMIRMGKEDELTQIYPLTSKKKFVAAVQFNQLIRHKEQEKGNILCK